VRTLSTPSQVNLSSRRSFCRYGLAEKLLAEQLESLYKVSRRGTFMRWNVPSYGATSVSSGCLGEEVKRWMDKKGRGKGKAGELTLGRCVNTCSFSPDHH
jgi:hypothetical protein